MTDRKSDLRNMGEELLQAVEGVKADKLSGIFDWEASNIEKPRFKRGSSRKQFAATPRISARTFQQWERCRDNTAGAAETLLKIVFGDPDDLRQVAYSYNRVV